MSEPFTAPESREDVERYSYGPTRVVESVAEILP